MSIVVIDVDELIDVLLGDVHGFFQYNPLDAFRVLGLREVSPRLASDKQYNAKRFAIFALIQ